MKLPGVGALLVCAVLLAPGVLAADHQVNINTADAEALMTLMGIGEVKAQAIIEYRNTNGSFGSKEEIQEVSGIGPATYDGIKDHIVVSGGSSSGSQSSTPASSPSPASKTPTPSPGPSSSTTGALSVEGGGDQVVVVDADVKFTAKAYLNKKEFDKGTNFSWNFGDGSTGRGGVISHRFEHPGRYVVIVTAASGGQSASDRFIITAEDAQLSLRILEDATIEIENEASRDVDLSQWRIRSGESQFFFPQNTFVLAEQSLRISSATLGFSPKTPVELLYPNGDLAFTGGYVSESFADTTDDPIAQVSASRPEDTSSIEDDEGAPELDDDADEDMSAATSSQVAAAASTSPSWVWWATAGTIALGAGAAVYAAKRFSRREWDIVEDTEG